MNDRGLRLAVDYLTLILATVKSRYHLPLISEMLEGVQEARTFTKLNLRGANNVIRMKDGNKYQTAL
jgi:hypothetical protein